VTLIPTEILRMWSERAETAHHLILQNLIDFKPFDAELQHGEKMQAYAEAAAANLMSARTFQDRFYLVRRFQDADLIRWFASGISFDHLDKAPSLAEATNRTPAQMLECAIEIGGKTGVTMTVEEMIAFALGENGKQKVHIEYHIDRAVTVILRKFRFLLKWDDEKAERFAVRFHELMKEFAE